MVIQSVFRGPLFSTLGNCSKSAFSKAFSLSKSWVFLRSLLPTKPDSFYKSKPINNSNFLKGLWFWREREKGNRICRTLIKAFILYMVRTEHWKSDLYILDGATWKTLPLFYEKYFSCSFTSNSATSFRK